MKKIKEALCSKFSLGKKIRARGGWIWNLDNNRVIKVVGDTDKYFGKRFMNLLDYLQKIDSPAVVKIHDFGPLNIKGEKCSFWFYVMDKLKPIPYDCYEDVFDDLLVDFYLSKKKSPVFISNEFNVFLKEAKKLKYKYNDLHSRNVMIDNEGKFKFIDLESFLY